MVWQLVVLPGLHTVTVVNSVLTSGLVLVGPASTTTLTTLATAGGEPPEVPTDSGVSLWPPPQPDADRHRAVHSPMSTARISAALPSRHRSERSGEGTRVLRTRACARPLAPPDRWSGPAGGRGPCAWYSPPLPRDRRSVPTSGADSVGRDRSRQRQTPCRLLRRIRAPWCPRVIVFRAIDSPRAR